MPINPNAALLARRLKEAGYSNANIAGVLGNFQLESGFNPRVNEGGLVGAPAGKGGYGFGQWTGSRQADLVNFARQRKKDPGDPGLQADFLLHELKGPEKAADEYLRGAVSPEESARRFLTGYERAGIPKTKQRQEAARQLYGQLGFLDQGTPPTTATPSAPVQKGNNLAGEILKQVLGAAIQQRRSQSSLPSLLSPLELLQQSTSALPMPTDYLNLFQ